MTPYAEVCRTLNQTQEAALQVPSSEPGRCPVLADLPNSSIQLGLPHPQDCTNTAGSSAMASVMQAHVPRMNNGGSGDDLLYQSLQACAASNNYGIATAKKYKSLDNTTSKNTQVRFDAV